MIPREILKKLRQIEIRTSRSASVKLLATFAVLSVAFVFAGCQSMQPQDPRKAVITALNNEDWNRLQKLAPPNSIATRSIEAWKRWPVRVGNLVETWDNHVFKEGDKPCMVYSYALENIDGRASMHGLQIVVRKRPDGSVELVDFWNFGW